VPPVIVRKYGGSSLASVDRILQVAADLAALAAGGRRLVVVVSAMGRHTDELEHLARQVSPEPARRELDMLLSVGERVTMALLSMALEDLGCPAVSFTGSQCGVITDESHNEARILEVRGERVRAALAEGRVVVVAGFQGVSRAKEITTLGRGGSDATAVALAAALGAERCEILKDVDAVFTADPHDVDGARPYDSLSYDELAALADAGCGVVHPRAVADARARGVPLFVGSSFRPSTGTRIGPVARVRCALPAGPPARLRPLGLVANGEIALLELETADDAAFAAARDAVGAVCRGDRFLGEWVDGEPGRRRWCVLAGARDAERLRGALDRCTAAAALTIRYRAGLHALSLAGAPPANWISVLPQVAAFLADHDAAEARILTQGPVLHILAAPQLAARLQQPLHDAFLDA
jgi:aspartate kinase